MVILATDLDGTFLAGDRASQRQLYGAIAASTSFKLIFVTGRGLAAIAPLLSDATIPNPDYIIADVGATVVDADLKPVQPIQAEIEQRWPGFQQIASEFVAFPGLELQTGPQERRCSFFYTEKVDFEAVQTRAARLGCDVICSAGRYLDIMPHQTNKGETLTQLLTVAADLSASDFLLTAGDTLNDLALLTAGFPGVVVGNAEQLLKQATRNLTDVYQARAEGAGGILEAMAHFGLD